MAKPVVYIHRVEWCPYELYMDAANEAYLSSFAEVRNNGNGRTAMTHDQMVEQLRGADAILAFNGAHAKELTQQAIEAAGTPRVISISHWWESFNDMVPGWKKAGVKVIDASDACSEAVAEWTIGAAIAGLRKFEVFDRKMKAGEKFPAWRGVAGQLSGSTVGLVALGRVGRYVLRLLKPFDVRVIVYDPGLKPSDAAELGVELVDLDTLLKTADCISLHAPVIPQTKGMIGARELSLIRDGALLLNCARAWLFDNAAFRAEMAKKRFRAYLDVFEPEPPPEDDILRRLDNVVLTPHVAGTTDKMFLRCGQLSITALRDHFAGTAQNPGRGPSYRIV